MYLTSRDTEEGTRKQSFPSSLACLNPQLGPYHWHWHFRTDTKTADYSLFQRNFGIKKLDEQKLACWPLTFKNITVETRTVSSLTLTKKLHVPALTVASSCCHCCGFESVPPELPRSLDPLRLKDSRKDRRI